ncbi:MAG: hypothetical protein JWR05_1484 [Mucilaginibacter sp.]|nr:hypothetical protein [Mucilaginibacter sp.]
MYRSLLMLISILFTCNCYSQVVKGIIKVKHANKIEIKFKGRPTYIYKATKQDALYLKDLILKAENKINLKCDSTGEIVYFKNEAPILKVYFSTLQTGSKYKDGAVVFKLNGEIKIALLNYGSFMLINELFYNLQKGRQM